MGRERNKAGRSKIWGLGLGLALWSAGVVGVAGATTITEFPLPTPNSQPEGIAAGPDGALWFTEFSGNKIGRITTAGAITEFNLPPGSGLPIGITAGPDGALWFIERDAGRIGRITTAGTITEFALPTAGSLPIGITAGPDGALWFTEYWGNRIGRITTAGTITGFGLPTPNSGPDRITTGPDGALWFTELDGNRIGRITTAGTITEFPLPTAGSLPFGITAGPDGALWFTEANPDRIGRITTAGTITEFPIPTASSTPYGITAGSDGALWFTERDATRIGRITTDLVGSVSVSLSGSVFHMDQTLTYEATLTPGSTPTQVDIYLGVVLPDEVTFLSLVRGSDGAISIALGPSPIPFQANVLLTQSAVSFSYTFGGSEPSGTYSAYARLTIPGSNSLLPENQLALAVQSFQFSSDVIVSVSVSGSGSVTSSPGGINCGRTCVATFAQGTTVTLTAQGQGSTFAGWNGDCASAGTHATCTLVMTTNKHMGASFSTAGSGGPGGYCSPYMLFCGIKFNFTFPPIRLF